MLQLMYVHRADSSDAANEFLMCQMSLLVSNVSIVHFGFEARIEGWQNINTFVDGNMIFLVCFSSSVGSSQL